MENNTENNVSQISAEIDVNCVGATDEQLVWFSDFRYWTEGVVQLILGTEILIPYLINPIKVS